MDKLLCGKCKGRGFCGRPRCYILDRMRTLKGITSKVKQDFFGSSPPSVFVGRVGYPDIFVGTLAPTEEGDTTSFDDPRGWHAEGMGIDDILEKRSGLVNSRTRAPVKAPGKMAKSHGKFIDKMQEVASAKKSVDIEARYDKPINPKMDVYTTSAPTGPSGSIEKLDITENVGVARQVDKVISDTDLKAKEGIEQLYTKGQDESKIQKLLSIGTMGIGVERKLVPTRWSITAVDDTIGKKLTETVKGHKEINEFRIYSAEYVGNHFEIILLPREWAFENIEVKFPGSVWNPMGKRPNFFADYEPYQGRKNYASNVTGAYYAARLAVLEQLIAERRQASVLVLREVYEDYYAPLGVWVIRETVREAMAGKAEKFATLEEALSEAGSRLKIPVPEYKKESRLLKEYRQQMTLRKFL